MSVDWLRFSPVASFSGGLLIGMAACVMILMIGRVAGVSGLIGGLIGGVIGGLIGGPLRPRPNETGWRVAFLAGLVAAPLIYRVFAVLPASRIDASWMILVPAGLLVGVGTRYGAGCTSGHGVCGLSRLSPRSLAAVCSFMVAGSLTVFVARHLVQSP